jgi:hypothetical protein
MATENRRKKERLRTKARERLPDLMRETGGLCFWCKKPITMIRTIESHEIVKRLPKSIYWRDVDGEILFALIATVDHLAGVEDENSNDPQRLVASCSGCNGSREVGPQSERSRKRNEQIQAEASIYRPLFRWLRRKKGPPRLRPPHPLLG